MMRFIRNLFEELLGTGLRFRNLGEEIRENPHEFFRYGLTREYDSGNLSEIKYSFSFFLGEHKTGYSEVLVYPKEKGILWWDFFPFKEISGARDKGLGSLAHVLIIQRIAKAIDGNLDDYRVNHHGMSGSRRKQLKRMGIDIYSQNSLEDYLEKSVNYVKRKGLTIPES